MPMGAMILVVLLLHLYVAARLLPALTAWPLVCTLMALELLCSAVLIPLNGTLLRGQPLTPALQGMAWAGFLLMSLGSTLFTLTLVRDLMLLAGRLVRLVAPGLPAVAGSVWAVPLILLVSLAVTLIGLVQARRDPQVVAVDVPLVNLPPALDGLTIAQLTDLHVGPTIRAARVRQAVETINGLSPDMVAVTGDLVDGRPEDLVPELESLGRLQAPLGVWFVSGNHEYYSGADGWWPWFPRLGLRPLVNEHVMLDYRGSPLLLAGVTDYKAARFTPEQASDPGKALAGAMPFDGVKILLAHQPASAMAAAEAGFDLQLSGHTHGGQFWPWPLAVKLAQPFVSGLGKMGNLWVYTSRGAGYWGPPNRFGVPSEITLVRLVRPPAEASPAPQSVLPEPALPEPVPRPAGSGGSGGAAGKSSVQDAGSGQ